ncbi:hypothetical protein, partial [Rhodococcus sp. ARC_M13]|uniref:hypothetical protein n=1 Tax=Rhodococcus sp. ARC_M13 TaxID=2928855 RepID=UPI001FB39F5C
MRSDSIDGSLSGPTASRAAAPWRGAKRAASGPDAPHRGRSVPRSFRVDADQNPGTGLGDLARSCLSVRSRPEPAVFLLYEVPRTAEEMYTPQVGDGVL